jgi:hypothetical protein
MGKSCGNCYRFNDGMYSTVCDECQVSGDAPPSMWKAMDSEPEKKLQTGYAFIPMDEYLSLFVEIGDLRKENAGLKAQVETLNKYVRELLYDLNGITEVGEVNE